MSGDPAAANAQHIQDRDLTIVLPAYNAASQLKESLPHLTEFLERSGLSYEIIVVDDGSTDGTPSLLSGCKLGPMRVFTLPKNYGKGAAIRHGLGAARGKYVVVTDADLPYGTTAILCCYQAVRQGAGLAMGDRTLPQSGKTVDVSLMRSFLSKAYRRLAGALMPSAAVGDIQCGLKGFPAAFAREIAVRSSIDRFAFDFEVLVIAIDRRWAVARLPVTLVKNSSSSFRVVPDSLRMAGDVLRVAWRRRSGRYAR